MVKKAQLAYSSKGNYDLAIKDFTQSIQLKPDFVEAYYGRGSAYYNKGNYDQAIKDYTQAIQRGSGYAEAYFGRGLAYKNKNDSPKAIADFKKSLELTKDPDTRTAVIEQLKELGAQPNSAAIDAPSQAICWRTSGSSTIVERLRSDVSPNCQESTTFHKA